MAVKQSLSVVQNYDNLLWGNKNGNNFQENLTKLKKAAAIQSISSFGIQDDGCHFESRVTSMTWSSKCPSHPYLFAASSKRGEVRVIDIMNKDEPRQLYYQKDLGPSGGIFSMKFNKYCPNIIYQASLDSTLNRIDIESHEKYIYHDTGDFNHWFTSMDYSPELEVIIGGDTKGKIHCYTTTGDPSFEKKINKSKVLHVEFNPKCPSQFVTASLDSLVKLWDIRDMKEPLEEIENEKKGVNIATFNSTGDRLLTSDQYDKIRVYTAGGGRWNKTLEITHNHRQFQHLTAIRASWHPLADIIVAALYPLLPKTEKIQSVAKPVQFIDADGGDILYEYNNPITNGISSLNFFNKFGDIMAHSVGRNVYFVRNILKDENYEISVQNEGTKSVKLSTNTQNLLRGVPLRRKLDDEAGPSARKRSKKSKKENYEDTAANESESEDEIDKIKSKIKSAKSRKK